MSFRLPLAGSALREMFDIRDLLPYGEPGGLLKAPTFRQAISAGREMMDADAAVKSTNSLCVAANGALCLLHVGPYDVRVLWNFSA